MKFKYLVGKIALGVASPKDYTSWAEEMLISGVESENISILAGLDLDKYPDSEEIKLYFKKSVNDLELEFPTDDVAIISYAIYICRGIIEGNITPEDGVSVLSQFYSKSDYEPIYGIWDELSDDIWSIKERDSCYFNTGLTKDNIGEYVRDVAEQFITLTKIILPEQFFNLCACQKCGYIGEHKLERIDLPWLPEKLYKLIYKRRPTHRAICSKCREPFPLSMGDYVARRQYLTQC